MVSFAGLLVILAIIVVIGCLLVFCIRQRSIAGLMVTGAGVIGLLMTLAILWSARGRVTVSHQVAQRDLELRPSENGLSTYPGQTSADTMTGSATTQPNAMRYPPPKLYPPPAPIVDQSQSSVPVKSIPWQNMDSGIFPADRYPGFRTAVSALVQQSRKKMEDISFPKDAPAEFVTQITLDLSRLKPGDADECLVEVRKAWPETKIRRLDGKSDSDDPAAAQAVATADTASSDSDAADSVTAVAAASPPPTTPQNPAGGGNSTANADQKATKPKATDPKRPSDSFELQMAFELIRDTRITTSDRNQPARRNGVVVCTLTGDGLNQASQAEFVEVPWIEQFEHFQSMSPGIEWKTVYSSGLAATAQEARASIKEQLKDIRIGTVHDSSGPQAVFADARLIQESFLQKIQRPYGQVFREAVLLRMNGSEVASLVNYAARVMSINQQEQATRQSSRAFTFLGLCLVFLVTAVIGMAINGITDGYFRRSIFFSVCALLFAVAGITIMQL